MTKTAKQQTQPVSSIRDWDLICIVAHCWYEIVGLSRSRKNQLYRLVYSLNDGYGIIGYVPCQGYDWSGIRDSSTEAHKAMAHAIRAKLTVWGIDTLTWVKVD